SAYVDLVREGVNTRGANGVFFVELLGEEGDLVRIRNLASEGRNDLVGASQGLVERKAVVQLLRGADVGRGMANPSAGLLFSHDLEDLSNNVAPAEVARRFSRAYEFISQFETVLRSRRTFRNFDPTGAGWLGLYSVTS